LFHAYVFYHACECVGGFVCVGVHIDFGDNFVQKDTFQNNLG